MGCFPPIKREPIQDEEREKPRVIQVLIGRTKRRNKKQKTIKHKGENMEVNQEQYLKAYMIRDIKRARGVEARKIDPEPWVNNDALSNDDLDFKRLCAKEGALH